MLGARCNLRRLTDWIEPLDAWLAQFLSQPWVLDGQPEGDGHIPTLALRDLSPRQMQVEMEFWLESSGVATRRLDHLVQTHCLAGRPRPAIAATALNGMLKGFIDLVFEHRGRYYVVDWKSNWLGPNDAAYTADAMRAAVLEARYDLQYVLYLFALHRQLRARLPDYDYDRHVGGAVYVFLRGTDAPGQGLFTDKPPRTLIEALDRLFAGSRATDEEAA
jgi:exodeoxyribonuclease V beta subunit